MYSTCNNHMFFQFSNSYADEIILEEVLVTAQRKLESLDNVPISVSALSAEQIEKFGSKGVLDLQSMVPGLRVDQTGTFVQPTIRGVGSAVLGPGISSNVAIYIDGFYQPSQVGNLFEFSNISQVQVLKGPQGALFGRNATGGAIIVNTLDPVFESTFKLKGTYARFNDRAFELYASDEIAKNLAADISIYTRKSDGDIRNIVTGKDDAKKTFDSFKVKLLHDTSEKIELKLAASYTDGSDARARVVQALNGNSAGKSKTGSVVVQQDEPRHASQDLQPKSDVISRAIYLTGNIDLEKFVVTSYTGYRDEDVSIQSDLDASSATVFGMIWDGYQVTRSQEISIQSKAESKLDWTAGFYYINDDSGIPDFKLEVAPNTRFRYLSSYSAIESYSAFYNATYPILESLYFTAGIRYAYEESTYKVMDAAGSVSRATADWENISPRVSLRYEVTDDMNVYGSYSEGFKSGVFNSGSYDTTPVDPEEISAYEVGLKSTQANWHVDIAAFYYDYSDLQVASYDFSAGVQTIRNAAEAEIYGMDTQIDLKLNKAFLMRMGLSYVDAEYKDFPGSISFVPKGDGTGSDPVYFNAKGNKMLRAPKFTGNIGLEYQYEFDLVMIEFNANLYKSGKVYFTSDNQYSEDGYTTLDLSLGITPRNSDFKLSFFINNVADVSYIRNIWDSNSQTGVSPNIPRVAGATLEYNL